MPKKKKLTEPEVHALIMKEARYRLGCSDFDPHTFPHSNWNVASVENANSWKPDCAQAFDEAVARARRKFDIEWRS